MSLVTLSDISSDRGTLRHNRPIEIGIREDTRFNRGPRASNEAPMDSNEALSSVEMPAESVVCAIEWLDIALDEIEEDSPMMDERIVDAKPRDSPGMTTVPSNPNDIRECVELILSLA